MRNTIPLFLFLCLLLFSCQKEIEVKLPDYEKKLVVEGYVENGQHPIVMISRSVDYMSNINLATLLNDVLISDAVVTVTSNLGEKEQLHFAFTDRAPLGFAYVGDTLVGTPGTSYKLEILWQDKKYTATTSILQPFDLDSVWFAYHNQGQDSAATIRMLLSDDPAVTNYYQFLVKVHGKNFQDRCWVTSIPVALDDATFNGQTFNFEIMRGNPSPIFAPDMEANPESDYYRMTFRPGDTVEFRYAAIDYQSYRFWSSANSDIVFGQNPFLSPTPICSNIAGENVMGVWCGYASKTMSLVFGK